jgi:hypothetical protein
LLGGVAIARDPPNAHVGLPAPHSPETETSMFKSMLTLVLTSTLAALAAGCASTTLPNIAFEPRVYPYVPEMGPDGPETAAKALPTK